MARIVAADEDQERVAQRPLRAGERGQHGQRAPRSPAPAMPASEIRELAFTRPEAGRTDAGARRRRGSRRTPWTRRARPARRGTAPRELPVTSPASTQHRKARIAIVLPSAHRRPWLKRSSTGPISGATIANGSIVSPRKSATWPRASSVGHLEEQRAGEADRDRRVAGGVEGVQLDEPGEPALAGALGVAGAAGLAVDVARRPRSARPGTPDPAARRRPGATGAAEAPPSGPALRGSSGATGSVSSARRGRPGRWAAAGRRRRVPVHGPILPAAHAIVSAPPTGRHGRAGFGTIPG